MCFKSCGLFTSNILFADEFTEELLLLHEEEIRKLKEEKREAKRGRKR